MAGTTISGTVASWYGTAWRGKAHCIKAQAEGYAGIMASDVWVEDGGGMSKALFLESTA
jgi:hypothetical protein